MPYFNKVFRTFLPRLTLAIFGCSVAALTHSNQNEFFKKRRILVIEAMLFVWAKVTSDVPAFVYCCRQVLKNREILSTLASSLINKLLPLIFLLSFAFKAPNKQFFKILFIRFYYFIVDLDVHILSSRAHPPTLNSHFKF